MSLLPNTSAKCILNCVFSLFMESSYVKHYIKEKEIPVRNGVPLDVGYKIVV